MTKKTKHVGMWLNVDGEPVHMLADPAMSDKTAKALAELVRAARKMIDAIPLFTCSKCGLERARAEGAVCGQCKMDEIKKDIE